MINNLAVNYFFKDMGFPVLSIKDALSIFGGLGYNSDKKIFNNTIRLVNKYPYGYRQPTFINPSLVVTEPSLAKFILSDEHEHFIREGMAWDRIRFLFGRSSIADDGEGWTRKRSHVQEAFRRAPLTNYINIITNDVLPAAHHRWLKLAKSGDPFDLHKEIYDISLCIAMRCFMDLHMTDGDRAFVRDTIATGNAHLFSGAIVSKYNPMPKSRRFHKGKAGTAKLIKELISSQKLKPESDTLISHVLGQHDLEYGNVGTLPEHDIMAELEFTLASGQLTVGATLMWTIIELLKHPDCQEILIADYDKHINKPDFTAKDLARVSDSKRVVKEVLRLYPSVWNLYRVATQSFRYHKHEILDGSSIVVSALSVGRNPEFWIDANAFQPERFFSNYNRYAYIPFNIGQRTCPANVFVYIEVILVISHLFKHFDIELDDKVDLYNITPEFKCTLPPPAGVKAKLKLKP